MIGESGHGTRGCGSRGSQERCWPQRRRHRPWYVAILRHARRTTRSHVAPMCTVALLLALASLLTGCGAGVRPVPRVILVHGAFEDASSWDAVAGRLRRDGIVINAPELPLKSLPSDADRVLAEINRIPGPVLLVGHSWGGTVITEAAADEQVVGLVYVAATAPTAGQSTKAQMASDEAAPASQEIASGRDGTLRISEAGMCNALAPGLATGECIRLTRSQRPIRATAFDAAVTHSRAHPGDLCSCQ